MTSLPRETAWVGVPPIKCQGIKTKLVPFILGNIQWDDHGSGRWIEPFMGSGVVALNLAPQRALLVHTNVHIINLYAAIQRGEVLSSLVREHLKIEGRKLATRGADYFYEVRDRFNQQGDVLDFLFLNRFCFNGVMRFNRRGQFNVPFSHKPERFAQSYITKISNQVSWVAKQMQGKDWEFKVSRWRDVLADVSEFDFIYLDPPYIGRHTDYYSSWSEAEATQLAEVTRLLPCGFALSMWFENRHRRNTHLDECWQGLTMRIQRHFYHVGPTESLRNEMKEALVIRPGYAALDVGPTDGIPELGAVGNQLPLFASHNLQVC